VLTAVIQEAYIQDISTRSVDELVKAMGMGGIARAQGAVNWSYSSPGRCGSSFPTTTSWCELIGCSTSLGCRCGGRFMICCDSGGGLQR
jgi:hypothetical protein